MKKVLSFALISVMGFLCANTANADIGDIFNRPKEPGCPKPPIIAARLVGIGGLCLNPVDYGRQGSGNSIQLWVCVPEDTQDWLIPTDEGKLGTIQHKRTKLCLDARDYGKQGAGTPIQLWNCNGEPSQQWNRVGNKIFWGGGRNLCLDSKNYGRQGQGTPIQLWDCNNRPVGK